MEIPAILRVEHLDAQGAMPVPIAPTLLVLPVCNEHLLVGGYNPAHLAGDGHLGYQDVCVDGVR